MLIPRLQNKNTIPLASLSATCSRKWQLYNEINCLYTKNYRPNNTAWF
uniref:Uncharacterized protein n=1 Tax=Rhizophora mucronata TaxID=61149 RepID=A0A2P2PZS6_RHIMU